MGFIIFIFNSNFYVMCDVITWQLLQNVTPCDMVWHRLMSDGPGYWLVPKHTNYNHTTDTNTSTTPGDNYWKKISATKLFNMSDIHIFIDAYCVQVRLVYFPQDDGQDAFKVLTFSLDASEETLPLVHWLKSQKYKRIR